MFVFAFFVGLLIIALSIYGLRITTSEIEAILYVGLLTIGLLMCIASALLVVKVED